MESKAHDSLMESNAHDGHEGAHAVALPADVLVAPRKLDWFRQISGFALIVGVVTVLVALPGVFLPEKWLRLVLLVVNAAIILGMALWHYRVSVTKLEVGLLFLIGVAYTFAFGFLKGLLLGLTLDKFRWTSWYFARQHRVECIIAWHGGPQDVSSAWKSLPCVIGCPFYHFIFAAICEETVKYLVVRQVAYSRVAVDQYAILVYGLVGGLAFGLSEGFVYILINDDWFLFIYRAVIGLFSHTVYGMLTACVLANGRFFGKRNSCRWFSCVWRAVLLHTVHNSLVTLKPYFAIFPSTTNVTYVIQCLIVANKLYSLFWLRRWSLTLDELPAVDVHKCMQRNLVWRRNLKEVARDFWCCCWLRASETPLEINREETAKLIVDIEQPSTTQTETFVVNGDLPSTTQTETFVVNGDLPSNTTTPGNTNLRERRSKGGFTEYQC